MKVYEVNPSYKIHNLYGFSEPASQKMEILIEMYHNTVVTLSYILFAIIFAIVVTVYYFRSSKNLYPIPFQKSVEYLVDALFVFMPIIIIYYLAVPAVGFIINNDKLIAYLDTPLTLEVTGHQWYWSYGIYGEESSYLMDLFHILPLEPWTNSGEWKVEFDQLIDLEVQKNLRCFEVNKHVILPIKELIKCEVHSEDVIHSWALPQLGVKVDAIPGRVQLVSVKAERTGVFYGQCSELCGVNHAFMPAVLEFVEEDSFVDWMMKEMQYRPYKLMLKQISV
jgi:heme/copper-type cytochrome/quinol oxidase subunit 2